MFQKFLFITCFLFVSVSMFSQEDTELNELKKAPLSIYTEGIIYDSFKAKINSLSSSLTFEKYRFLRINEGDIASNLFTVDFMNIGRKATSFYYNSYQKADLYKHFLVIPEISTLHRFNNSYNKK
jgi:hypothetical protein